jgi:hypothetical protein
MWIEPGTYKLVGARMESEGKKGTYKETYTVKGDIRFTWKVFECRKYCGCSDTTDQYCGYEPSQYRQYRCILELSDGKGMIGSKNVDCSKKDGRERYWLHITGLVNRKGCNEDNEFECIPEIFISSYPASILYFRQTEHGIEKIHEAPVTWYAKTIHRYYFNFIRVE